MLCVCSLALFSFSSRSRTNTLSQGKAGDTGERPLGSNRALEEDSVEQTRIARVLYLFWLFPLPTHPSDLSFRLA